MLHVHIYLFTSIYTPPLLTTKTMPEVAYSKNITQSQTKNSMKPSLKTQPDKNNSMKSI